jgi:hypothetical protein
MGGMLLSAGELQASREHFEAGLAAYDERRPQRSALGSDLGVFGHAWSSHTFWLLGEAAEAMAHADQGIALARRRDHRYSLTIALAYAALLHQMRGDVGRLLECAEQVVALCARYGFRYYDDWAQVLIGWARGLEQPAESIGTIEAALGRLDAMRARARRPYYLSLLADTTRRAGRPDRSAELLATAIEMAVARVDAWWLPALYLQRSDLEPEAEGAQTRQVALDLARTQTNRFLEQRILQAGRTLSGTL